MSPVTVLTQHVFIVKSERFCDIDSGRLFRCYPTSSADCGGVWHAAVCCASRDHTRTQHVLVQAGSSRRNSAVPSSSLETSTKDQVSMPTWSTHRRRRQLNSLHGPDRSPARSFVQLQETYVYYIMQKNASSLSEVVIAEALKRQKLK